MFPGDAAVVTPSDTVVFPPSVVYAGSNGNLRVMTAQGTDITFNNVVAGSVLPVQVIQVLLTGTTVTNPVRIF